MTPAGFPDALETFVRKVEDGEYWESHEVLEGPWRETGSDFLQGLILYASAFVHLKRENAHGVRAQLGKALVALEGYPDAYLGVDVDGVREHARRIRELLDPEGEPPPDWTERIDPPRITLRSDRLRGDEVEVERMGAKSR